MFLLWYQVIGQRLDMFSVVLASDFLFPHGNLLYLQVKSVEQELDPDDEEAALTGQMQ